MVGESDRSSLRTNEGRLEEGLRATETLVSDGDDLTVGKLVALLQGGGGGGGGHLVLEVQSHIAKLLLDVAHDLTLSCEETSVEFKWGKSIGRTASPNVDHFLSNVKNDTQSQFRHNEVLRHREIFCRIVGDVLHFRGINKITWLLLGAAMLEAMTPYRW